MTVETQKPWAWGLTAAGVVAAGLLFWAARGAIAPALDRWLPATEAAPAAEPPATVETEPAEPQEPAGPVWTFADLEAALEPLPGLTERLIAEGRAELPEFADLDSTDPVRARQVESRWQSWGRIWRNRIAVIRRQMPPVEDCRGHAAIAPTCNALGRSFAVLVQVPASGRIEDARKLLDRASAVLEALRPEPVEDVSGAAR